MTFAPKFDKIVVNDDLDTAQREAYQLISGWLKN